MENRINHIIARVLSGETGPEDIFALSEWLTLDEKNKNDFLRIKSYWEAEVSGSQSFVSFQAVERLQQKIEREHRKQKRKQLVRVWGSGAAVLLVLFISSAILFFNDTEKMPPQQYTYLAGGHKTDFTLPDGTLIALNKNSRLTYTGEFGHTRRCVRLEGEAYFEVAKDSLHPFDVEMNGASIRVLGTHFNVKAEKGSDRIIATLIEGSIRFRGAKQRIIMVPNQQLCFDRSSNKVNLKAVDPEIFIAWKDELLKYVSIPLVRLVADLEKNYKVEIRLENEKLTDPLLTVSGTFSKDQNIDEVLKVISRSIPITWSNRNGIYRIR